MFQKTRILIHAALVIALSLVAVTAFAADARVVNVNTADQSELALLPRVGPALAQRIVEFRDENGKFEDTADLMLVRGIGEKTFALMEAYVTIEGETTLGEKVRTSDAQRRLDQAAESDDTRD